MQIDQGSVVEVMYYSLFKRLGLSPDDLKPVEVLLIGFSGAPVYPFSMITLPVRAGSRTQDIEFMVVDLPSPYNSILGRNWL